MGSLFRNYGFPLARNVILELLYARLKQRRHNAENRVSSY